MAAKLAASPAICYASTMDRVGTKLSDDEAAQARERRLVAQHLQAIEDSPPTPEQIAMFEMFERECWSHERRLAFIRDRAAAAAIRHAAE